MSKSDLGYITGSQSQSKKNGRNPKCDHDWKKKWKKNLAENMKKRKEKGYKSPKKKRDRIVQIEKENKSPYKNLKK